MASQDCGAYRVDSGERRKDGEEMVSGGIRAASDCPSDNATGDAEEGGRVVGIAQGRERSFIYFFSAPGRIKIGITRNIPQRLAEVGAHLEAEPSVLGFIRGDEAFERHIHSDLSPWRMKGEWFQDCGHVRAIMARVLAGETLGFVRQPARALKEFSPSDPAENLFGKVCKTIWPNKTAEHLAVATGRSVRSVFYELSGEREPSTQSLMAVFNAIAPK